MGYPANPPRSEARLLRSARDYFCCPDEFLHYRLSGELSPESEYFEFGSDTLCYGRSVRTVAEPRPAAGSPRSAPGSSSDATLLLPFDPDEAIDNLRLERYPGCRLDRLERKLKSTYYSLRPFTSRPLRGFVQRFRAGNWKNRRFPRWPVDTTVENICEGLLLRSMQAHGVDSIPFIWFWPGGAQGCVVITHDVETSAGRDFCSGLMDLDASFGFLSSFHVVPEVRYAVSAAFLNSFRDRGFEVCVQDLNHDGRLFDDPEEFRRRAALINRYGREFGARGFRSGVLYRNPEWFGHFDFSFDMSVPNVAPLDPQRGGCCTVMPYFIGRLLELPLTTVQDYTLFHVLREKSVDLWRLQLEIILAKNGIATFLVHPDYILDRETQAIYRDLLTLLRDVREKQSVWCALPREVDAWWRMRSRLSIVRDDGSWRIVGEGAESARLAFARNSDGRLTFEMAVDSPSPLPAANRRMIR